MNAPTKFTLHTRETDPELQIIDAIVQLLHGIDNATALRVLRYLTDRWSSETEKR